MSKIITLLFVTLTSITQAQIIDLREKRGYKDFQFGDQYEKWKNELASTDTAKCYLYMGNCCEDIFDYKTHQIYLTFDANFKLTEIAILFPLIDKEGDGIILTDDLIAALENFESYIGKHNSNNIDSQQMPLFFEWITKHMVIRLEDYSSSKIGKFAQYINNDYNFTYTTLLRLKSRQNVNEALKNKF